MGERELKIKALTSIWGWASVMCEGLEVGELSDHFRENVIDGQMTEEDAMKCQKMVAHESDIIWRKIQRYKP